MIQEETVQKHTMPRTRKQTEEDRELPTLPDEHFYIAAAQAKYDFTENPRETFERVEKDLAACADITDVQLRDAKVMAIRAKVVRFVKERAHEGYHFVPLMMALEPLLRFTTLSIKEAVDELHETLNTIEF